MATVMECDYLFLGFSHTGVYAKEINHTVISMGTGFMGAVKAELLLNFAKGRNPVSKPVQVNYVTYTNTCFFEFRDV